MLSRLADRLFEPVDIASLVFFRVVFGAVMLWEVWRYFSNDWIARYYIEPEFHFTFYGFGWVQPWPGDWMYVHFLALGVLAAMIVVGLAYRVAAALFFLGFTYVFLLEQARYLNHFYLIVLLSLLLVFLPANRALSLDALLRPRLRADAVPAWTLFLLRAQIGLVFVFAGIAKLNGDWLRGEPLRTWLAESTDTRLIGRFFEEPLTPYLFSYGGLLLDLLLVPLLLWRRTRPFAFLGALAFNLTNAEVFQIGIFPWLMIGATLMFFPPDWPRFRGLRAGLSGRAPVERPDAFDPGPGRRGRAVVLSLLAAYLAVQLLVPLRHLLYPGPVAWTEEGHQFSWRMKLRNKEGTARLIATDPRTGKTWQVAIDPLLAGWQESKVAGRPDLVLQLARYVADELRRQGRPGVEIRALVLASLNGREPQLLIDPSVDLAREQRTIFGADWIEPLR